MTTAVDTCVLLDYVLGEPGSQDTAESALREAYAGGALIIGEVVYAELMPQFADARELEEVLGLLGISFVASSTAMAAAAGAAWGAYRKGGGPRNRLIADFLVGAHAMLNADRLLTRDRRFYGAIFADLDVMVP
jgi:hypothetical protein